MAAQAVLRIKDAEDAGKELVRRANEQARQIMSDAAKESDRRCKEILDEAQKKRLQMMKNAEETAENDCGELIARGENERDSILSPPRERLDKAVELITERIVRV